MFFSYLAFIGLYKVMVAIAVTPVFKVM